jgi:hypothetical protein
MTMNYTVEIVLAETLDPTDEKGIPTIRLQERFSTVDQATDTARAFIKNLERAPGSAYYRILDPDARSIFDARRLGKRKPHDDLWWGGRELG